MAVGVLLHRCGGGCQVAADSGDDLLTLGDKVGGVLNFTVLKSGEGMIQRQTHVLFIHHFKRRELCAGVDGVVQRKLGVTQLKVPVVLPRRHIAT